MKFLFAFATLAAAVSGTTFLPMADCACLGQTGPCFCSADYSPINVKEGSYCSCYHDAYDRLVCDGCEDEKARKHPMKKHLVWGAANEQCMKITDGRLGPVAEPTPCAGAPQRKVTQISRGDGHNCDCLIEGSVDGHRIPCPCKETSFETRMASMRMSQTETRSFDSSRLQRRGPQDLHCMCIANFEDGAYVPCGCDGKQNLLGVLSMI
ncbi:hypothetical protein VHEMI04661 [[Torrubiella] hemipterigena]|uniref:Uncharacterized protein n=1 Tax=[Torrubiella] hemipterigena TaxID=1531966 RepID=A0A0A1T1W5_9HYPO|nr:hypothetical protein VHEMI04661 [[Torrubiella] hemipterigena]